MSHPKQSRLEFRPGFREQTQCSYWDYYIDGKRLADVLGVGDFIPPFGWLPAKIERGFAEMLLRNCDSNFKPGRVPLFVCPECVDYGCGVYTCSVSREGDSILWRNFAMENDYEDGLRQDDAEKFGWYAFDVSEYHRFFEWFLADRASR